MNNYSVLMSVYHKENPVYLYESITSILEQTILPSDFVLVCDGPLTNELDNVINEFEGRYPILFQIVRLDQNKGLGNALNIGLRYCKYNLVARMDSDDIALPDRCERELSEFQKNKALDIVSGTILEFRDAPSHITNAKYLPETNADIHIYAKRRCPFNHPCVMYKKDTVLQAGGYVDCPLFEDYHLWIRMLENGAVGYNIQVPLLLMRANSDMYHRRGGISYVKKVMFFRTYMLEKGFCSKLDYFYTLFGHMTVSLVPNKIREKIYKRYLRNPYDGKVLVKNMQKEHK